jgi:hypothetical protein
MKITIDTHHCSREELAELKKYLEDNSWDFSTDEPTDESADKPKYILKHEGILVVGSDLVVLNDAIQQEDLHEYSIIHRESFIDELYGWISEAIRSGRESDRALMEADLAELKTWEDDYIFSSNSTNSYIGSESSEFEQTCEELIVLNNTL